MEGTTDDMRDEELQLVMNHLEIENIREDQMRSFQTYTHTHYTTIADFLLSIAMVITSSLLIYGVHKGIARFFVPILVLVPIDFLVRLTFVCVHSINLGFLHPISIAMNFTCSIGMIFDIFIWLCIFSHRQQLNDELDGLDENEMKPV